MIIHINGNSGSGKSTLGEKLKKTEFTIIETDDIDDDIMLKLIKKYPNAFDSRKETEKMFKIHDKLYEDIIYSLIEKNKNIIFVGIIHHKKNILKNADYKYYIKIEPEVNFKQLAIRTLNDLCKNRQDIESMIVNSKNLNTTDKILLYKYKIRAPFPFDDLTSFTKKVKKRELKYKNEGYKIMESKDILNDIKKLL